MSDRQEVSDTLVPEWHHQLEETLKRPCVLIAIIADEHGISLVGNTTRDGMPYYLTYALESIKGKEPDREWEDKSRKTKPL